MKLRKKVRKLRQTEFRVLVGILLTLGALALIATMFATRNAAVTLFMVAFFFVVGAAILHLKCGLMIYPHPPTRERPQRVR